MKRLGEVKQPVSLLALWNPNTHRMNNVTVNDWLGVPWDYTGSEQPMQDLDL
jgi:hypothetical protein